MFFFLLLLFVRIRWNVGRCFTGPGQRKFLAFELNGELPDGIDWLANIYKMRHLIYRELVRVLAPIAGVVPIRVDNVRVCITQNILLL